jgi:SnoaL-like domain
MALADQNRCGVIKYLMSVVQDGDLGLIDDLFAEKIAHNGVEITRDEHRAALQAYQAAFGPLTVEILRVVAEAEVVVVHWRIQSPRGEMRVGVNFVTVRDGRCVAIDQVVGDPLLLPERPAISLAGRLRSLMGV